MSISDNFFMMAECIIHEGDTIYFWRDTWNQGVLQWKFPHLYSYALNKNILAKAFRYGDIHKYFWGPLSIEASDQLVELQLLLQQFPVSPNAHDKWKYI
jgi:hypothetical protein